MVNSKTLVDLFVGHVLVSSFCLAAAGCSSHGSDATPQANVSQNDGGPGDGSAAVIQLVEAGDAHPVADSSIGIADASHVDVAAAPILSGLDLSAGSLSPAFDTNQHSYRARLGFWSDSLSFIPAASTGAVVTIHGATVIPGNRSEPIAFSPGMAPIDVFVGTPANPMANGYKVSVTQGSATLQALFPISPSTGTYGAVSISGDRLAIGLPEFSPAGGLVVVFARTDNDWKEEARLTAPAQHPGDEFGASVSLDRDRLAVGAPGDASDAKGVDGHGALTMKKAGTVYMFARAATGWNKQAQLKASNTAADSRFGQAVALNGDSVAVSAPGECGIGVGVDGVQDIDPAGKQRGAVYIFGAVGPTWSQSNYLKSLTVSAAPESFGSALSFMKDTLAVGTSRAPSGSIEVFIRDAAKKWTLEQSLVKPGATPHAVLGESVSVFDDTLVAGGGFNGAGAPVFHRKNHVWTFDTELKTSKEYLGHSVSIHGDAVAVTASVSDGHGDFITAACIYTRSKGAWNTTPRVLKAPQPIHSDFGAVVAISEDALLLRDNAGTGHFYVSR